MAEATDDTDQIEHDLAQTRARMDRRLDELGNRLAPDQLVNDALAHVTGSDGADFAQTLIAKAKANPVPAALAAIGVAWLMASSQDRQRRSRSEPDLQARLRSAEAGVVRLQDEHPDVHASRMDDARGQVLGIARDASDTAVSYGQRIKDAMATATRSVRETAHDLGSHARAGGASTSSVRAAVGNPLVLGGAAALVGLIAGSLMPLSDAEEHALGAVGDQVRSRGRDLAQDIVDRGAQVAGDALGAAKDSAQAHGLTADRPVGELLGGLKSGELLGKVKEAAHEVASASTESVRSQLGGEGSKR